MRKKIKFINTSNRCRVCLMEGDIKEGLCIGCAHDIAALMGKDHVKAVNAVTSLYMHGLVARLRDDPWKSKTTEMMHIIQKHLIAMFADLDQMNRGPCPTCGR